MMEHGLRPKYPVLGGGCQPEDCPIAEAAALVRRAIERARLIKARASFGILTIANAATAEAV